jgi:hypothetical protein
MNSGVEPRTWSRGRLFGWVLVVFAIQLGFIFWMSDRRPPKIRQDNLGPSLTVAVNRNAELLALADPTLFALPHQQSFSGEAWLNFRRTGSLSTTNAPEIGPGIGAPLAFSAFGRDFSEFMATNPFNTFTGLPKPEPQFSAVESSPAAPFPSRSGLEISGGLASRHLISACELPGWSRYTNALGEPCLLSNTVLRALVNAEGKVLSVLLISSSGWKEADTYAMEKAKAARFDALDATGAETVTNPLARLHWGELSFAWETLPPSSSKNGTSGP